MAAMSQRPSPVIIDLGPVIGGNVSMFGERLGCKLYVEDLFAEIESHAQKGTRAELAGALTARLTQEAGTVDGILCWDLFDYLDRKTGQALGARLTSLLRSGGAIHGMFGNAPAELRHYTRFIVESDSALRHRTYPATPVTRVPLVTRDIQKMFDGLVVAESVLLKSNIRETLFRKP